MATRPNILLMISHDLGRHLGCYGAGTVRSPRLDALAGEGVRFDSMFCAAPQCSPSRAALFTGRFPHSNGVMGLCHSNFGWDLHPAEKHLAEVLRDAGYRTALVGVQHETFRPERLGYEQVDPASPRTAKNVSERAVGCLAALKDSPKPFFLNVGFFEPHRPFDHGGVAPDREKGVALPPFIKDEESAREDFAGFQGAIRTLDSAVGDVLDALDRLGLREKTLVIFTSDHGMPFPLAKLTLYDPGLAVSLILRWPGRAWTGGAVRDQLLSNVDLFPTILSLLSLPIAENLHGRSFLPLLDGGDYAPREQVFGEMTYHNYYDPMRCVRTRTHKLIVFFASAPAYMNPCQTNRPLSHENDKFYALWPNCHHGVAELYDLRREPWEKTDLFNDPSCAQVRADLIARLRRWMQDTRDPMLGGIPPCPLHHRAQELLE